MCKNTSDVLIFSVNDLAVHILSPKQPNFVIVIIYNIVHIKLNPKIFGVENN